MLHENGRWVKAGLVGHIFDDNGRVRNERIPCVRVETCTQDRITYPSLSPAGAGAKEEGATIGLQLEDFAKLNAQRRGGKDGGISKESRKVGAGEGLLPKLGYVSLLLNARRQRIAYALLLGNIAQHLAQYTSAPIRNGCDADMDGDEGAVFAPVIAVTDLILALFERSTGGQVDA
jgi:hypothetical protein